MPRMNLEGSSSIVTGGASGIGEASARQLADLGSRVVIADLQEDRGIAVANSLAGVGNILSTSGRVADAADLYRKAINISESLARVDKSNIDLRRSTARNYARLGQAVLRSGSLGDSLVNYNKSLDIFQKLASENPSDTKLERSVGILLSYIGYVKMEMGEYAESVRFYGDSLKVMEKLSLVEPFNQRMLGMVSTAYLWLGIALIAQEKPDESLGHIRQALAIQTKITETDKGNFGELNGLAECYLALGRALTKKAVLMAVNRGRAKQIELSEAVTALETALAHFKTVGRADSQNLSARRQSAFGLLNLADAWRLRDSGPKALSLYMEALTEFEDLTRRDANNTEWQHDLAYSHLRIGQILLMGGNRRQAFSHSEKARLLLEKLSGVSPDSVRLRKDLETVQRHLNNSYSLNQGT